MEFRGGNDFGWAGHDTVLLQPSSTSGDVHLYEDSSGVVKENTNIVVNQLFLFLSVLLVIIEFVISGLA
jgi:hypothetical protein